MEDSGLGKGEKNVFRCLCQPQSKFAFPSQGDLLGEESCSCVQSGQEAPSSWPWVGVSLVELLIIHVFFLMAIPVIFRQYK